MSSRWFRFYADAMRNPKVAKLSDKQFRLWVELLAVASENDGVLPCLDDLRFMLNRRLDHLSSGVEQLISMGLIDRLEGGYEPHNWNKFQYKSDSSSERVAKHRAKRNVSETAPDTETDTELPISKDIGASDKNFWDNSKAYLKPHSSNPGALIGKWCKGGRQADVAKAITAAQLERAVDPIAYIERCMKNSDALVMPTC
jgi:hypothetical protein